MSLSHINFSVCVGNPISHFLVSQSIGYHCFRLWSSAEIIRHSDGVPTHSATIEARYPRDYISSARYWANGPESMPFVLKTRVRKKKQKIAPHFYLRKFVENMLQEFGKSSHEQLHFVNNLGNKNRETQLHAAANEIRWNNFALPFSMYVPTRMQRWAEEPFKTT